MKRKLVLFSEKKPEENSEIFVIYSDDIRETIHSGKYVKGKVVSLTSGPEGSFHFMSFVPLSSDKWAYCHEDSTQVNDTCY